MKKDRMPEVHFYEWSVSRWTGSTTRMLLDSSGRGIYRELIDLCYTQGSCPKDPVIQARFCGCTEAEIERVWPSISKHFFADKHDSSRLRNAVADVYRKNYFGFCKRQKKNRTGSAVSVPQKPNKVIGIGDSGQEVSDQVCHTKLDDTRRDETIQDEVRRDDTSGGGGESAPPPKPAAPLSLVVQPEWKRDEAFSRFAADYLSTGGAFIDEDFLDAHQWCWKKLDFEQRLERVRALAMHLPTWTDPGFIPRPRKFLETEWKRPALVPKIRSPDKSFVNDVTSVIEARLQRGEKPW